MHSHRPRSLPPVALETLADRAGATVVGGGSAQGVLVTGVSLDSRTVRPGDLYAALPGAHAHGATFVAGAVAAGAVAVLTDPEGAPLAAIGLGVPILLVEAPRAVLGDLAALVYGHPADAMRLIGVTGTNGKTTTAYLIESALRGLGARTGLIGTVETRVGDERLTSRRTTPEAPDLHAILAVMREAGTDSVVMEVSSHALAQHRVDGVVYDVALFTNLSQDHLDYHAGMADYFAAKAALFSPERAQRGVVCIDDEWGVALAQRRGIPLVTVSSRRPADWTLTAGEGPEVTLVGPGEQQLLLHCHLPGTFNLVNTAMA
ncbi:MAG TPA: UDP-N-acetylmuramyl-tripeptide synthetase, partial [Dermatophilaceae bacterium]|nr:UDP-N-acetylmuramyl-tripeptide synthetase [Dermatophilaceae bacterium]